MTSLIPACAISGIIIIEGVRHLRKGVNDGWIFIMIGVGLLANESMNVILSTHRGVLNPATYSILRQFGFGIGLTTLSIFIMQIVRELKGRCIRGDCNAEHKPGTYFRKSNTTP